MENYLFDLKIKELKILKKNFEVYNDIIILYERYPTILGCRSCYMQKPIPTENGYKVESGNLVNYYEKFNNDKTPKEIAINLWLCPICYRVFRELIPNFNYGYKICQPIKH